MDKEPAKVFRTPQLALLVLLRPIARMIRRATTIVVRGTSASHRGPVRSSWYLVNRPALRSKRTRRGMILSARTAGLMPRATICSRSAPGAVADRRGREEADGLSGLAVARGDSAADAPGAGASCEAKYAASSRIVGWSYRRVGGTCNQKRCSSSSINSRVPRESRPASNSGRS
jgi:hypothetical protein